jgi:hypothetical protein
MELKKAVAVCLISLCSAALVVLIARALDMQAAARLEPQLAQIAAELRAIRQSGGMAAGSAAETPTLDDGLMVYDFHATGRCAECNAIEAQTHELLKSEYAAKLTSGEIAWKVLNYDDSVGRPLAMKFEVPTSMVVLVKMKEGKVERFKRLEKCRVLVSDKTAFSKYVRDAIEEMLKPAEPPADTSAFPVPEEEGKK